MDDQLGRLVAAAVRGDRGVVHPLLDAVATQIDAFTPTQHVLGFVHCQLGESSGHTVRLHVWTQPRTPMAQPAWPVHSHRWKIDSHVLCGWIEDRRFQTTNVETARARLYEVHYLNKSSRRIATREAVDVRLMSATRWTAGQRYFIPPDEFHTTVVPEDVFAATLVVTGQDTCATPLVVGLADAEPVFGYEPQAFPLDRFATVLDEIRAKTKQ